MNIYVAHSSAFNFQEELYTPLRQSLLNSQHNITLPHEQSANQFNSKEFLKRCDLVLAEVSYPSTGQGIELGWADMYQVPIIFFYKKGSKVSTALQVVSTSFIEYENQNDMIEKLAKVLEN